jgi:hypothetical protein
MMDMVASTETRDWTTDETTNIETTNTETTNIETTNIETSNIETANIKTTNIKTANIETTNIETANIRTANIKTTNIIDDRRSRDGTLEEFHTADYYVIGLRTHQNFGTPRAPPIIPSQLPSRRTAYEDLN